MSLSESNQNTLSPIYNLVVSITVFLFFLYYSLNFQFTYLLSRIRDMRLGVYLNSYIRIFYTQRYASPILYVVPLFHFYQCLSHWFEGFHI